MLVDIIFVSILFISILVGYHRGFLRELYDLIGVLVITIIAYLFRNSIPFDINFETTTRQLIFNNLKPVLTFIIIFTILIIIYEIVVSILIKKDILKNTAGKLDHYGAVFSGLMAIVILMIYSFGVSLTPLINKGSIFENSKITKDFLRLNKPLYDLRNNIISIKTDADNLRDLIKKDDKIDKDKADEIANNVSKNPIVTRRVIKETVQVIVDKTPPKQPDAATSIIEKTLEFVRKGTPIVVTEGEKDELLAEIRAHSQFPIAKAMYDKNVIDTTMILDILSDNGVSGLTEADIIKLFEGE